MSQTALMPTETPFEEVIDAGTGEITYRRRGRPLGSKNKLKTVEEKLEELGCDPIVRMATIAVQAEARGDQVLAAKLYAELAQYTAAKKKSVEVTIETGDALTQALQLSSADRMLRITELMERLGQSK